MWLGLDGSFTVDVPWGLHVAAELGIFTLPSPYVCAERVRQEIAG
jgi:hypothetical protein